MNKFLPIGSVVLLNNAEKKLVIVGYCSSIKDENEIYDYVGMLYPEGMISAEHLLFFNHSDISKIYYVGYTDKNYQDFNENLLSYVNGEVSDNE